MTKYFCNCCGTIFSDDTADVREETMSEEYWGRRETWTETRIYCPYCGSEYICEYCGNLEDGDNIADEESEEEDEDDD